MTALIDTMSKDDLKRMCQAQAAVMCNQEERLKAAQKRIKGLLKRWDEVHTDGLSIYYRTKVQKLLAHIKHLQQNSAPRGYGVGQ